MELIRREDHDRIALLKLSRSVTNALDPPLIHELTEKVQESGDDPEVHGVVLNSSSDKFFSIGFDIPELYGLSRQEFTAFFKAFNRLCMLLYTLPKPTVVAIPGHAIAGGCILALCCHYRFIAEGRKLMGLNEVKLGVPVPYPADRILRQVVGARTARHIMDTGEFYEPEALRQMGMVDQVLPLEQVLQKAIEKAESLGAFSPSAFMMIKRNRVEDVEAEVLQRSAEKERLFVEGWYSDETRKLLLEAMKKF